MLNTPHMPAFVLITKGAVLPLSITHTALDLDTSPASVPAAFLLGLNSWAAQEFLLHTPWPERLVLQVFAWLAKGICDILPKLASPLPFPGRHLLDNIVYTCLFIDQSRNLAFLFSPNISSESRTHKTHNKYSIDNCAINNWVLYTRPCETTHVHACACIHAHTSQMIVISGATQKMEYTLWLPFLNDNLCVNKNSLYASEAWLCLGSAEGISWRPGSTGSRSPFSTWTCARSQQLRFPQIHTHNVHDTHRLKLTFLHLRLWRWPLFPQRESGLSNSWNSGII